MFRRGRLISISGVDGSGKTTQIALLERKTKEMQPNTVVIWSRWRPISSLPILALMKLTGRAEVHATSSIGFVETRIQKDAALAAIWCFLTQLDNLLKTGMKVMVPLVSGNTVICDRYILDLIVENMADLHDDPRRMRLGHRLLRLLPRPTHSFLIDVEPKVAFERKPDMPTLQHFEERVRLYKELANTMRVQILDGRLSPEAIHREIWNRVSGSLNS